ncbi:MAG TPA: HAMP domain-containing sensor histidine kinase [Bacteroidales bacterium]|nr:HAMP domain-containing sensor histidine kinase [Bacteroidales bacterium]HPS15722.1 HAMP domain-containing sensor histidine kinase [Bacteroidales bacterium]
MTKKSFNIYHRKQYWKWFLLAFAFAIVGASLWYTNVLVKKIAKDEREKAQTWADAVQKKASLVRYTEIFFEKLKTEERKRVEIWAEATKRLIEADNTEDLTFYSEIISGNTNIPVILIDDEGSITAAKNVDFNTDSVKTLTGDLKKEFTIYDPIIVSYGLKKSYLYYKDSKLFTELRQVLDDLIKSFISEVVINSASVPVIITDSTKSKIIAFGNLDSTKVDDKNYLNSMIESMQQQNKPVEIELSGIGKSFIFYKDSFLLTQLKYYPYIQFLIIGLFLLVAYFLFSTSRKAEQNQVWVGMAKETAHQLGTPLSSLMAWVEILKLKNVDKETIRELEKDAYRFNTITQRFSNIGSQPKLEKTNIVKVINNAVDYMKARTSQRVQFSVNLQKDYEYIIPLNEHLFEWVMENLCKNAIDAMEGEGKIDITITVESDFVNIDIADTGKGMAKSKFKTVFKPGYTSKQRGWGLGLSLSKRIIEEYHKGKIFVKNSVIDKGTTFRIALKRE